MLHHENDVHRHTNENSLELLLTQRHPCNAASFPKPTSQICSGERYDSRTSVEKTVSQENALSRKTFLEESRKVTRKVIASRFCIELLIKTLAADKRLSRYTSALDCHLLTTPTLCLRGSVESTNRGDVVLPQLSSYMLRFCFLETLNMSSLLRIHEDEPKFRAVYWKLWRNEAARTEFGSKRLAAGFDSCGEQFR